MTRFIPARRPNSPPLEWQHHLAHETLRWRQQRTTSPPPLQSQSSQSSSTPAVQPLPSLSDLQYLPRVSWDAPTESKTVHYHINGYDYTIRYAPNTVTLMNLVCKWDIRGDCVLRWNEDVQWKLLHQVTYEDLKEIASLSRSITPNLIYRLRVACVTVNMENKTLAKKAYPNLVKLIQTAHPGAMIARIEWNFPENHPLYQIDTWHKIDDLQVDIAKSIL